MSMDKMISYIGKGVIIENGSISATEDFAVEGKIVTKLISSANVLLGQSANFEGLIIANNLEIKGQFKGSALVKNDIIVRTGSNVEGVIKAINITVESGAIYKGTSETISPDAFNKEATTNKIYSKIMSKAKQLLASTPTKE